MKKLFLSLVIILGFILSIFLTTSSQAAMDQQKPIADHYQLISQYGGTVYDLAQQGDYIYVARGPRIEVWDISNSAAPMRMGQTNTLPAIVYGVDVLGNYLYAAIGSNSLIIIDVTDPTKPTAVAQYEGMNPIYNIVIHGATLYAMMSNAGAEVLDISAPTMPTYITFLETGVFDIAFKEKLIYIATGSSGLKIMDMSNPIEPQPVGMFDTPGFAVSVEVIGDYAYVADGNDSLQVIDVSNPATPMFANNFNPAGYNYFRMVHYNPEQPQRLYVAEGYGFYILDVTNPAAPTQVHFDNSVGGGLDVLTKGNNLYFASNGEFGIFDISNEQMPLLTEASHEIEDGREMVLAGDYAYIADVSGLVVMDVSYPTQPQRLGSYASPGVANGITLNGNTVYLSDYDGGIRIIDVSDPTSPTEIGFHNPSIDFGNGAAIKNVGSTVYALDYGRLGIFDMSVPASPMLLGSLPLSKPYDLKINGNYAYITDYKDGLIIVDISNPNQPMQVGQSAASFSAISLDVKDSIAYVVDTQYGLRVFDVANPINPVELTTYPFSGQYGLAATAEGDTLYYVADNFIHLFDISNPAVPAFKNSIKTICYCENVNVVGNLLFVSADDAGLAIYRAKSQIFLPTIIR